MNTAIEIKVKGLGLAAYIKMKGATLLRMEDRYFIFESHTSLEAWRVQYSNSCCHTHDALVCEMRNFLN